MKKVIKLLKILDIVLLVVTILALLYCIFFGREYHDNVFMLREEYSDNEYHLVEGEEIFKNEKPVAYNIGRFMGPFTIKLNLVNFGIAILSILMAIITVFNKELKGDKTLKKDRIIVIILAFLLYCISGLMATLGSSFYF